MKNMIRSTAIALCFVTLAAPTFGVLASECNASSPKQKQSDAKTPVPHPLEGIWEQRFAYQGKWTGVLKAEVIHVGDSYRMVVLEQVSDGTLIPSLGISKVHHVIDTWTFDSDWGSFGTGNFVLKRQTDDRYVGYAYQDGQQRGVNEWVRIAKPVAGERAIRDDERIKVHESETSWLIIGKWKSSQASRTASGFQYDSPVLTLNFDQTDQGRVPGETPHALWEIPKSRVPDVAAAKIELRADVRR